MADHRREIQSAKYKADAEQFGITEAFAAYSTRLKISIDKGLDHPHRGLTFFVRARVSAADTPQ